MSAQTITGVIKKGQVWPHLLVAGYAAVFRKVLTSRYPTCPPPFPSAALIKALLINGADILGPTASNFVPSNESGHGRLNIANAYCGCARPGFLREKKGLILPTSPVAQEKIDVKARVIPLSRQHFVWLDPLPRRENSRTGFSSGGCVWETKMENVEGKSAALEQEQIMLCSARGCKCTMYMYMYIWSPPPNLYSWRSVTLQKVYMYFKKKCPFTKGGKLEDKKTLLRSSPFCPYICTVLYIPYSILLVLATFLS